MVGAMTTEERVAMIAIAGRLRSLMRRIEHLRATVEGVVDETEAALLETRTQLDSVMKAIAAEVNG